MHTEINTYVPKWFWAIAVIALLWYLMDMSAFFMRTLMLQDMLQKMPDQQQALYSSMPSWVNIVFAAEVFGGVFGSLCLLFKKRWALILYCISIVGVLLQTCYVYFLSESISVMGTPAIVMPLVAIFIGISMILVTRKALSKSWIN
ncbi:MAG: hypothetical protein KTR16_11795 [Acidiferrobacterales bacterium]|nr:hypothetical protein [Acidiferrobacterales bacterium]